MDKAPMTVAGYAALEVELKHLKSVERPNIIKAIAEARAHGDLSENAEYHSAREKQGFIEGRIALLEAQISNAEVIDSAKFSDKTVRFSATVVIYDDENDQEITYQIVGVDEADLAKGKLSYQAPLAKALIGRQEGDMAEVHTPKGPRAYEIVKVTYQ
jgi:transcription elongation factor GreA